MASPYEAATKELHRDKSQLSLKLYSSLLALPITLAYFTYRIYGIGKINTDDELSPSTLTIWIYFFAEQGIFLPKLLNNLFRVIAIRGGSQAPCLRYVEDTGRRIDIFVVCCGEGLYTVLNTVRAACASHYPSRLLRIFLLDDSGSRKLESAVSNMKQDNSELSNLF